MEPRYIALFVCSLGMMACREEKRPPETPSPVSSETKSTPSPGLVDTQVSIALHRGALGLSLEKPIAREAGTINGVEASISGYVRQETEHFLVLSRHPRSGDPHERDDSLLWIPYSSILTIRQQYPNSRPKGETAEQSTPWRLEAVEGLMNLIGFNLKDLPEGNLQVWVERGGKKDFLDDFDTHPGQEQWLYFGIDPYKSEALMMTVVSEENQGLSKVFLPVDQPKMFHKSKIEPNHDWTKSTLLASESPGSGNGKVYALLTPKTSSK